MPANVETMAYMGETPWHGNGYILPANATPKEAQEIAKLNWKVSRRIVRMTRSREDGTQIPIDGYMAIVRDTDNRVYQIASDRYKPVQNDEVVEYFSEFCNAGELTMETLGSLDHGAVIWALAKVNHGSDFTLAGGDNVKSYVLLANSHDGSLSYQGMFTSVRVVCANTLAMARQRGSNKGLFKMKHSTGSERRKQITEDAQQVMAEALGVTKMLKEKAQLLSETKVDNEVLNSYVYQLTTGENLLDVIVRAQDVDFTQGGSILDHIADTHVSSYKAFDPKKHEHNRQGKAILEAVRNSPGAGMASAKGTMWGALNGVTYYADYESGRNQNNTLRSAWFGKSAELKASALDLAVAYSAALGSGR